jgi:hypothetical protein
VVPESTGYRTGVSEIVETLEGRYAMRLVPLRDGRGRGGRAELSPDAAVVMVL